ncbi:MAG: putative oxidoreductase [Candidatus Omnitrophica bacterium ADurb.Bin277]|nr:MAG: putative oxidoreductase [Candidatus Omnitrophica bacterium ADurb.Bin277]
MSEVQKKAIVIGTGSGIGRALAFELSRDGYFVGLTGRDPEKLEKLRAELPGPSLVRQIDLRNTREAVHSLGNLIMQMQGMDLLVVNAGVLFHNSDLDWSLEEETIKVNVLGFAAMADVGCNYFLRRGKGTLAGISSVAGHRGSGRSPAYNASKAFMINYMEGLRQRLAATPIKVVDVRPGFVDTNMIRGRKGLFGVVSTEKAAGDILRAIKKGKRIAYVPGWWAVVMWFFKRLPESLYHFGYRKYIEWDTRPKPGQADRRLS